MKNQKINQKVSPGTNKQETKGIITMLITY